MAKNNTPAPAEPAGGAERFTLEQLRAHRMALFGVEASTFDGATFGMDEGGTYTVEEIRNTIERWGKKEAK